MTHHKFPAWYYGPNGESKIVHHDDEIPEGWHDHPAKHDKAVTAAKTGSTKLPTEKDKVTGEQRGSKPVQAQNNEKADATGGAATEGQTGDVSNTLDRDGWGWDEKLHASTRSLTKDGLWRMKVGVSRPDPKPGYPKPDAPLDL